jgi:hypothetical protein
MSTNSSLQTSRAADLGRNRCHALRSRLPVDFLGVRAQGQCMSTSTLKTMSDFLCPITQFIWSMTALCGSIGYFGQA